MTEQKNTQEHDGVAVEIEPQPAIQAMGNQDVEKVKQSSKIKVDSNFWKVLFEEWRYCHSKDFKPYCIKDKDGHQEVWDMSSPEFFQQITQLYFEHSGSVLKGSDQKDLILLLMAIANFKSPQKEVYLRYAYHEGSIYVDLLNENWEQVRISPEGWEIISAKDSPVYFIRKKNMLPLPIPEPGGDIDMIMEFLNADEQQVKLLIAFLIASINPRGPFPILVILGQQGSAKSMVTRLIKRLVDPTTLSERSLTRSVRSLAIALENCWLLAYDNVSGMSQEQSDMFCRIATGGGFGTRKLRTDDVEMYFTHKRPLLFNGIPDFAARSDFADRALVVQLDSISDDMRKTEAEIEDRWTEFSPRILGALYDVVSFALKNEKKVESKNLPRMADFAKWLIAAEGALWKQGTFMKVYQMNRDIQTQVILEDDSVASFLIELMKDRQEWMSSPSDLLASLNMIESKRMKRGSGWPKGPNVLSGKLRRLAPALMKLGLSIAWSKSGKRFISIKKVNNASFNEQPFFMVAKPVAKVDNQVTQEIPSESVVAPLSGDPKTAKYLAQGEI